MKLTTLSCAIALAALPMTGVFAAAMDRSGQSISAFLQPGNYFEAGISVLDATVTGVEAGETTSRKPITDMADSYYFPSAAFKWQAHKNFSVGLIYDQPFGAAAEYSGDNAFVSKITDTVLPQATLDGMVTSQVQGALAAGSKQINDALSGQNTPLKPFNELTAQEIVTAGVASQLRENGITPTNPQFGAILQNQVTGLVTQAGGFENAKDVILAGANAKGQQQLAQQLAAVGADKLGVGNTKVEVHTNNLTLLVGYQPNENWNFYAGPVYQTVKGKVNLRGQAYSIFNGYDANIKETGDFGWLAGVAYQIPEIALKASLTYRSEVEHTAQTRENFAGVGAVALLGANPADIVGKAGDTVITTPQSVNLDLQSGIMANTVAFANIRWVDWSSFAIRPYQFGLLSETVGGLASVNRPDGFDLVAYTDDQISVTAGVGRKFSEQWAGNVSVGWDSGAGNPVSTLGPTEGYWNVGLGLQFSPTPATFIAGGVKYFWLGDAKSQTAAQYGESDRIVGNFQDNDAWGFGLKMGYKF